MAAATGAIEDFPFLLFGKPHRRRSWLNVSPLQPTDFHDFSKKVEGDIQAARLREGIPVLNLYTNSLEGPFSPCEREFEPVVGDERPEYAHDFSSRKEQTRNPQHQRTWCHTVKPTSARRRHLGGQNNGLPFLSRVGKPSQRRAELEQHVF